MRVENKLNINNKITEWLSEHNEALNDLSNYCGINKNELLAAINRPLETNKVILNDGTEFSVLKRDKETNVALLKNENSGFYNVACGINKENNGWEHSLVYCENYDTAKLFYANKTAEKMDYERYRTIGYLKENYPSIELENLVNIVNDAKEIYQYSVDDQVGERITLEDLSEFITKMYIENNYQDKGYTFVQSPIHNMESTMLLEKFYDYDFKNEASKSLTVTNIDNIHYLTSKTVNELKTNDEENVHYMDENKKELSKIWFPEGTKIKLNHMNDQTKPVPEGTIGTVKFVDDEGTIHMQWENGSSLALILGEDDFEVVEENTMEKPFSRTISYYKNFAFGNNDQVYESTVKELKREIETRWFYHAEANINGNDEESYKNFIDWTRMVIQIHDMDDEEFVDKILKGHSDFPSIEDIGLRFINDGCNVFKSNVINRLLYEAQKITSPKEDMNVLAMISEKCFDLIDMSNEDFF